MKFESHITLLREHSIAVNEIAQFTGWTYSQIDGDPIMGKQAYCYLTAYDASPHILHSRMMEVVRLCKASQVEPLRTKIEAIVFDSKTDVDVLGMGEQRPIETQGRHKLLVVESWT